MCDPCVYVKDDNSSKLFVALYVDGLRVTGSSEVGIFKTKVLLVTKFAMKDLGDVSLILGMQVRKLCQRNSAAIRVCRQQIGKHTRH